MNLDELISKLEWLRAAYGGHAEVAATYGSKEAGLDRLRFNPNKLRCELELDSPMLPDEWKELPEVPELLEGVRL